MVHLSESSRRLSIHEIGIQNKVELLESTYGFTDVCLLHLPASHNSRLNGLEELIYKVGSSLADTATLIILGDTIDLVHVHEQISSIMRYQLWVAIKKEPIDYSPDKTSLPKHHIGALIYTKYDKQLQHTKTRLAYTYCPACNKTTKDYGGKKHTYHHTGTLISDIWRDIVISPENGIQEITARFADLFGLESYNELRVYNLSTILTEYIEPPKPKISKTSHPEKLKSSLILGDCLEELRKLPENSIDFAFADPPYNLKKEYRGYSDDLDIADYFNWCDEWITEIARVLKPGGTFTLLNIPLGAIRHFLHLEKILTFQNWIAWDALSFPVRMIMPAHYTILCFSKGTPRSLPGLIGTAGQVDVSNGPPTSKSLDPLAEGFCIRPQCVTNRLKHRVNDRGLLSDIWWDIHRLKHNTRRVDHPCQLPPQLMYRLIAIFTEPNEIVLDCFNGAGTTTLAAHQLGRRYIGIEREAKYYQIASERHQEIEFGIDPFRKEERVLTAKNSRVARVEKIKYEVPKKTLQLEVRRVAQILNHLPSREDMIQYGQYPIRYYDEYFSSWGEVCAAARTTGMKETPDESTEWTFSQKRLF